jgi:hypothetical protein
MTTKGEDAPLPELSLRAERRDMTKTTRLNAANERIKREYFRYLAEAKGP